VTSRTTVRKRAGTPPAATGPTIEGRKPGQGSKLIKAAFFGPPKTGKTTLATSGGETLLVQFDPEGDTSTTLQGRDNITVVEPSTYAEVVELVRALYTTDAGRWEYLVFDSLTFFFQMIAGKEITAAYMSNTNIMRPYGRGGAGVSQVISDAVRLPMHVIFNAHLQVDGAEDSVPQETALGEHEVKLAVTPMVWKTLGPAVSIIGRTYKQRKLNKKTGNNDVTYRVSFNDGERSPAGVRNELQVPAELEITTTTLTELAASLKEV